MTSGKGGTGWYDGIIRRIRRGPPTVRPVPPDSRREWAGVGLMLAAIVFIELFSTHVFYLGNPGFFYWFLVMFIACWAGLRSALIGCALLVLYIWLIYRFHFSILVKDYSKAEQSIITTAIFYPLFAIIAGVVQIKLRNSAIREFDAREAADSEARQRKIAETELDLSEEMRRLIISSSIDAIVAMDEKGIVNLWNPIAESLFGWTSSEAIGRPLGELILPEEVRPPFDAQLTTFLETGEAPLYRNRSELSATTRSGRELEIEIYIAPHKTPLEWVFILFARDISERKYAEQAIRDLNVDLENRVATRTAELETANSELVGFTHSISHDLRTPLRGIVGNCRILLEDAKDALDSASVDRLLRLETAALRMAELIDNLLQFARIGQVALNRTEVDISAIAESLAGEMAALKPGSATVEPGLIVDGDYTMLQMLMRNLLENAWKYVQPGEKPRVEIGRAPDGSIFVRDYGIGFDTQYANKIWEPFERLHRDAEFPGTGIGLANAKRIVVRHGGEIWAESEPNKGSTFYVRLHPQPIAARRGASRQKSSML